MTAPSNLIVDGWEDLKFWDHVYKKKKLKQLILDRERLSGNKVLPPQELWFRSLEYTHPDKVKCVILGQDPYHTPGIGHGLAFSIMPNVKKYPPTLKNIFKEYQDDLGYPKPMNGYLKPWADNGVLLLNTCLTVDQGKPFSHKGLGWELLTYEILRKLSDADRTIVFIFWGRGAAEFKSAITKPHHGVLLSGHPSPLAMGSGSPFLGSKPFTRCNAILEDAGCPVVQWRLPS